MGLVKLIFWTLGTSLAPAETRAPKLDANRCGRTSFICARRLFKILEKFILELPGHHWAALCPPASSADAWAVASLALAGGIKPNFIWVPRARETTQLTNTYRFAYAKHLLLNKQNHGPSQAEPGQAKLSQM